MTWCEFTIDEWSAFTVAEWTELEVCAALLIYLVQAAGLYLPVEEIFACLPTEATQIVEGIEALHVERDH